MEKLQAPAAFIPDNLVLQAAALGAKSLGLGQVKEVSGTPPANGLDQLADRLIALQRGIQGVTFRQPEIIDGEAA